MAGTPGEVDTRTSKKKQSNGNRWGPTLDALQPNTLPLLKTDILNLIITNASLWTGMDEDGCVCHSTGVLHGHQRVCLLMATLEGKPR